MEDSELNTSRMKEHLTPRPYTVLPVGPRTSLTPSHTPEELPADQDSSGTPALGRGASAAIAGAAERVTDVIQRRLEELGSLRADIDREAADFVRHMTERADALQAHIESYARQCGEVQEQIKEAGRRVDQMPGTPV
jgi:hypothetical protein